MYFGMSASGKPAQSKIISYLEKIKTKQNEKFYMTAELDKFQDIKIEKTLK